MRLARAAGARDVAYQFESLDYPATERRFNSYYAEFLPVAPDASGRTPTRGRVHLRAGRAH